MNLAGGPSGIGGLETLTTMSASYSSIADSPALFRADGSTLPGGTLTITYQSAAPGLLCGIGACWDFDLALLFNSPSVQFCAGKPSAVEFLSIGTSNAMSQLQQTILLPNPLGPDAGRSGMVQGGDVVNNVAYLSNPIIVVFGF
jgi:hypothetical protein